MEAKTTIYDFLNDLLTAFKQEIQGVESVELYSGQFTTQQLSQIAKRTPAILLSLLGISSVRNAPEGREVTLELACFVLVGNAAQADKSIDKNLAILPFVESIVAILDGENIGGTFSSFPENIQADNLYSATGVQVAVWSIKWEQNIMLGITKESLENLDDFLRAGMEWQAIQPDKV